MGPYKILVYLAAGTVCMLVPILLQARWKNITRWKSVLLALCLTITGTIGTLLLFYFESGGKFGGTSFFGAVFLVPLIFFIGCKVFSVSFGKTMDLCASAECVMLAVMKIRCLVSGCCAGIELFTTSTGQQVLFPSQSIELLAGLAIAVALVIMAKKEENDGTLYPWYMILYGVTRFVLNWFRTANEPFVWFLPPGNFWSLISILIGAVWLVAAKKIEKSKRNSIAVESKETT